VTPSATTPFKPLDRDLLAEPVLELGRRVSGVAEGAQVALLAEAPVDLEGRVARDLVAQLLIGGQQAELFGAHEENLAVDETVERPLADVQILAHFGRELVLERVAVGLGEVALGPLQLDLLDRSTVHRGDRGDGLAGHAHPDAPEGEHPDDEGQADPDDFRVLVPP
jgi:hypothetical protein